MLPLGRLTILNALYEKCCIPCFRTLFVITCLFTSASVEWRMWRWQLFSQFHMDLQSSSTGSCLDGGWGGVSQEATPAQHRQSDVSHATLAPDSQLLPNWFASFFRNHIFYTFFVMQKPVKQPPSMPCSLWWLVQPNPADCSPQHGQDWWATKSMLFMNMSCRFSGSGPFDIKNLI